MNGRVLLDTNIVIALFAKELAVQQNLAASTEVFVSSIVLGELYYGARKSARITTNVAQVDTFAASNAVLVCDTAQARTMAKSRIYCVQKVGPYRKMTFGLLPLRSNMTLHLYREIVILTR